MLTVKITTAKINDKKMKHELPHFTQTLLTIFLFPHQTSIYPIANKIVVLSYSTVVFC